MQYFINELWEPLMNLDLLLKLTTIVSAFAALYPIYKKYRSKPELRSLLLGLSFKDRISFPLPNIKSAIEYFENVPIEIYNGDKNKTYKIRQCSLEECVSGNRYINWLRTKFEERITDIPMPLIEKLPVDLKPTDSVTLRIPMVEALILVHRYQGKLVRIVIEHSHGTIKSKIFYVDQFENYYFTVGKEYALLLVKGLLLKALEKGETPDAFLEQATDLMKKIGFTDMYAAAKIASIVEEESKVREVPIDFVNAAKAKYEALKSFYRMLIETLTGWKKSLK